MPPSRWQQAAPRPRKITPASIVPFSRAHMSAPRFEFQPSPFSFVETAIVPTMAATTPQADSQKGSAISLSRFASVAAAMIEPTVGLEEVGAHAGDVADVVSHVVRDHGRVVRVVLVDAGLDLADEVGTDVGGLRVDAARDAREQRDGGSAEAETRQDLQRLRLAQALVHREDAEAARAADQAEADDDEAHDGAGLEGDAQPSLSEPVPPVTLPCESLTSLPAQAAVVRVLPSVATIMPSQPADADRMAPRKKANVVSTPSSFVCWSSTENSTQRMPPSSTTKTESHLYSSFRKAMAPSLIMAPYLSTSGRPTSLPVGSRLSVAYV